jgi:hypothetical protein
MCQLAAPVNFCALAGFARFGQAMKKARAHAPHGAQALQQPIRDKT